MRRVLLRNLAAGCILVGLGVAIAGESSRPIRDDALLLAALRAVFPRMQVSIDRGKRIDEGEASENLDTGRSSDTRQVRLKLFPWPGESEAGLLAVLQYDFIGANPSMSCPSIGLLAHLVRTEAKWRSRIEYLLETVHHSSLQEIDLTDLTGDGVTELVIESNFGGAGSVGSSLQVFDLSHGDFRELLDTPSRLEDNDQEGYTQVLDADRTLRTRGQQFCTQKKTIFENGVWFSSPRFSNPCYARGAGVRAVDAEIRQQMLSPLH